MLRLGLVGMLAACTLAAQQGLTPRQSAEMTVSIGAVSIGADEHGRSELCHKLAAVREEGFPVVLSAKDEALTVQCEGRPAKALELRLSSAVKDPKRAVCEYGGAPAALAYDRIDWVTLRRGGKAMTGQEIRDRLEPLGVRTFAALLFAFGFERIEAQDISGKTLVTAPLHQIDGFCASKG